MATKVLGQEATDVVIKQIKKRGKKKVNDAKTHIKYNINTLTRDQALKIKTNGARVKTCDSMAYLYDELADDEKSVVDRKIFDVNNNSRKFVIYYNQLSQFYIWPIKVRCPRLRRGVGDNSKNWYRVFRRPETIKSTRVSGFDGPIDISAEKVALAKRARYIMKNNQNINRIDLYFDNDWDWGKKFIMTVYYWYGGNSDI